MIARKRGPMAILKLGTKKEYYTFDDGWHAIRHPGYYITQYMQIAGKTVKEMTRWTKVSQNDHESAYVKITRKDLRALRRGRASVTPDFAKALEVITGIRKTVWLETQEAWDEVTW